MGQKIQAVKGMNDLLPLEQKDFKLTSAFWQAFEDVVGKWTRRFGYSQIRTPILEQTGLFVRSIGEISNFLKKAVWTFRRPFSIDYLFPKLETSFLINAKYLHNSLFKPNQYVLKKFNKESCFYSI